MSSIEPQVSLVGIEVAGAANKCLFVDIVGRGGSSGDGGGLGVGGGGGGGGGAEYARGASEL